MLQPLQRLGAEVTGIDAAERSLEVARMHSSWWTGDIKPPTFVHSTVEDLAKTGAKFDVVVASEVIEHVNEVSQFVESCSELVADGGALVVTTLNRTAKSYALAIVAAEHLLRLVPVDTHDWHRFLTPKEVGDHVRENGLSVENLGGMFYNPVCNSWSQTWDTDVNYFLVARKSVAE